MKLVASVLLLASVAYAAPQFPNVGSGGISPDQRAIYLPVMRALLRVMEAGNRPSANDINQLLIATRELNKRVPKGQNLLGNFGGLGGFGNFDISGLENMGLPETGDIVTNVGGVPHVKTTFGAFPLSDTSLMTASERAQFLPVVRTFTSILEKGNADPNEINQLLGQVRQLNSLIPANMRANIEQITGLATSSFNTGPNFASQNSVPSFNAVPFNPTRNIPSGPIGGTIPTSGITANQRATYLPVMRALLKVMESNIPDPRDINTLLIATRELNKRVPKGQNLLQGLGNFGGFGGQALGQFGIDDATLQNIGLPETGDIVTRVDGVPHIRTSFGVFPLTSTSLMTPQEKQQFLPVVRSFTRVLENGGADVNEANALLAQANQLTSLLPANFRNSISGLTNSFSSGRVGAPTPSFNNIGSIPSQGITADQRATYLPVMRALLKVMSTSRPAAQDINTLLIQTRELNRRVPKGQNLLGSFGSGDLTFGIDNLEGMGLPETGDLITNVNGVPHIKTTFGVFPLSSTSLMTDQERQQFLPIVRQFTNVLEKGSANAAETQSLVREIQKLNQLIPANIGSSIQGLLGQING